MGIGSKLTRLMKDQNTNANELSAKSGVPAQTIYSLIRRDASKIEIDSLIKIARALGVTADYFCSDDLSERPHTLAAHFEGEDFTPEELSEIEQFVQFVKSKRGN